MRPTVPLPRCGSRGVFLALILLLQGKMGVFGYYRRSPGGGSAMAFSRGHDDDGDSSQFFAFGGWSMGSQNDITISVRNEEDGSSYPVDPSSWLAAAADEDDGGSSSYYLAHQRQPESSNEVLVASAATATATNTKGKLGRFIRAGRKAKKEELPPPSTGGHPSPPSLEETTSPEELASLASSTSLLDKETILIGAAQPLVPGDVWNQLTGDEYEDPKVVDALAQAGLHMATNHEDNGWVDWKGSPLPSNIDASLDNGEILVYAGNTLRSGFGSEVPWIKSLSVLPMTPAEGAELMMDSSRVKSYNSLSLGRDDLKIMSPAVSSSKEKFRKETKIVRNVVQLPVSNSKVESVTLLHTRQLENGAHLLVSRALGGTKYSSSSNGKIGRSFILLGVNLFEPVAGSPDECRMTAVTHVYSPGIPLMLAGKVGVKSAKKFIKDIRALCEPVSQ